MASGSTKVVVAALLANLGIACAKGVAAVVTGSGAMLAETIHSLADSGNQALLLLGQARSKRPPDARHPFGYGSERYFWAFIVALVLFSLGAGFSLYEGFHKLAHPTPLSNVGWAYGVLTFGILIESISLWIAHKEMRKVQRGRKFWATFFQTKSPAIPLVYLEDIGAVTGMILALIGVTIVDVTGWKYADGVATVLVGLLLGAIAIVMFVRCHKLLIGESATREDGRAILEAARSVPGVKRIVGLQTLHVGPENLVVLMEAELDGGGELVDAIEAAIQAKVPHAKHIAIEPA